jgi:hypothetical protein
MESEGRQMKQKKIQKNPPVLSIRQPLAFVTLLEKVHVTITLPANKGRNTIGDYAHRHQKD